MVIFSFLGIIPLLNNLANDRKKTIISNFSGLKKTQFVKYIKFNHSKIHHFVDIDQQNDRFIRRPIKKLVIYLLKLYYFTELFYNP